VCTPEDLGAYERVIEFSKEPESIEAFTRTLDHELQKAFTNYADERNYNKTLKELIVHKAPQGAFHSRLKTKNKMGGQFKVPKLANNRVVLDELLAMLHV
jgi:hypothetical protein